MLCCRCLLRCAAGKKGHAAPMRTTGVARRRVADKPVAVDRTVRLREPDSSSSVRSASWERAQR
ncbi:hypothetical protein D0U02_24120 [Burkholderia pseudomallei]|uniref:Uncharacterized protein n=3 Tax=Burkholderia pseudomallei TaxID=28450 RepID=A0AAX0U4V5_BURPE|nr:hypothetical protein BURPS668_A2862 [Burkholderia pseudomallei 668]ABN95644.1 hypothetical protein BURPS1106A_A2710 [Burkholderia pseudomallei 1106a]ARK45443.1 hypothetical protein BOC35_02930 [Burkholderia pseudomallei]EEH26989.1 conserved hypothetical protein [Burkholderia pseudomallei Pakistan 9]EES22898.1 hypothetical protein BURPS1106B_2464 [Burkholderia pseudomallei 1106b]EET05772.1 hypothetical protein BURPS1710A_A1993 [Burkholderia pseudomallei 1710a]PNX05552.1 hypothetical protein